MATYTAGVKTICPFYIREARKSITCEGLIDGTDGMMRFDDEAAKQRYQEEHCECADYFSRCRVAEALHKRYESGFHQAKVSVGGKRLGWITCGKESIYIPVQYRDIFPDMRCELLENGKFMALTNGDQYKLHSSGSGKRGIVLKSVNAVRKIREKIFFNCGFRNGFRLTAWVEDKKLIFTKGNGGLK